MSINLLALDGNITTVDATSFTTNSISPSPNTLILLAVASRTSAAIVNTPTASGNSLTWVVVSTIGNVEGDNRQLTLFRAMSNSPSPGIVTIDFAGQNQTSFSYSICQFSGVNTSGTNGSDAIVQSLKTDSAVTGTSYTENLSSFGKSGNSGYGVVMHLANEGTTPGNGWSEIHDFSTSENAWGFQTEWKIDDNIVTASWSSNVFWQDIAIQILGNPTLVKSSNILSANANSTLEILY